MGEQPAIPTFGARQAKVQRQLGGERIGVGLGAFRGRAAANSGRDACPDWPPSSLALVAQKLRAALYNDSTALDADGAPLLAPSETWSVAAINGTVHALVGEALNLLELEPEQAEPAGWRSLLGRLNLSHSDAEQLTPRLADGPLPSSVPPAEAGRPASAGGAGGGGAGDTLLRLAFREQRERRARELLPPPPQPSAAAFRSVR